MAFYNWRHLCESKLGIPAESTRAIVRRTKACIFRFSQSPSLITGKVHTANFRLTLLEIEDSSSFFTFSRHWICIEAAVTWQYNCLVGILRFLSSHGRFPDLDSTSQMDLESSRAGTFPFLFSPWRFGKR